MERGSEVLHQTTLDQPTELIRNSGDWGYAMVVEGKYRGVARGGGGQERFRTSLVSWWMVCRRLRQEQSGMQPTTLTDLIQGSGASKTRQ